MNTSSVRASPSPTLKRSLKVGRRLKTVALPIVVIEECVSHAVRACAANIFGMIAACCCTMAFRSMTVCLPEQASTVTFTIAGKLFVRGCS